MSHVILIIAIALLAFIGWLCAMLAGFQTARVNRTIERDKPPEVVLWLFFAITSIVAPIIAIILATWIN